MQQLFHNAITFTPSYIQTREKYTKQIQIFFPREERDSFFKFINAKNNITQNKNIPT